MTNIPKHGASRCSGHGAATAGLIAVLTVLACGTLAAAQGVEYDRPVDTAPAEKDIGGGYTTPAVQRPRPRGYWSALLDVALLTAAMGLATWVVLARRSRKALLALTIGCLIYFGFYRKGCVCPIGSIQNVVLALTDGHYAIPIVVTAVFFLPLVMAVFFGRVFCGGVCPLGAIQEVVLLKPLRVPGRLDKALGLLKYVYLALAVWFVMLPAAERDFIICRFDPFVGLFRRSGFAPMLLVGGGFLLVGMFVGRPYCRYLCPYGGLLSWCARLARHGVTITPDKELDCGLCSDACPYGAIENMRAVRSRCLYCARCYAACPRTPGPRGAAADDVAGTGSQRSLS